MIDSIATALRDFVGLASETVTGSVEILVNLFT